MGKGRSLKAIISNRLNSLEEDILGSLKVNFAILGMSLERRRRSMEQRESIGIFLLEGNMNTANLKTKLKKVSV